MSEGMTRRQALQALGVLLAGTAAVSVMTPAEAAAADKVEPFDGLTVTVTMDHDRAIATHIEGNVPVASVTYESEYASVRDLNGQVIRRVPTGTGWRIELEGAGTDGLRFIRKEAKA